MANNCKSCINISIGIFILIGFSISELVIYKKSNKYLSSDTKCPIFPNNLTYWQADKIIEDQWNWKYSKNNIFDNNNYKLTIQQVCPSVTHDADIYLNGIFISRSDGKIITLTSTTYIRDCHKNLIYIVKASDIAQMIINKNKIFVNKQIEDNNGNIIGYFKGKDYFIDNEISIINKNGNQISTITRNKLSLTWSWKFNIYNNSSPYLPGEHG